MKNKILEFLGEYLPNIVIASLIALVLIVTLGLGYKNIIHGEISHEGYVLLKERLDKADESVQQLADEYMEDDKISAIEFDKLIKRCNESYFEQSKDELRK